MINIAIYEDTQSLRKALSELILSQPEFKLVGSFGDCKNLKAEISVLMPDVVILDIGLPEISGLDGLVMIKELRPTTEVIIFTVFEDDNRIFEAIKCGASGYILKSASPFKIIEAIKDIMNGGAPISPLVAKKILETLPMSPKVEQTHNLSARESEVLHLLSNGYSQKMIAENFGVSINTVKTLVKRVYQKLNVHSVTEALSKLR
jgi:DNA-binding NarL/FixJ family response regulator